jgi:hypothetical protein
VSERKAVGSPMLRTSTAQVLPYASYRKTLFTRIWRPSAVLCALWPLTATSTEPRPTAGASVLLFVLCCTLLRCVYENVCVLARVHPQA